MCSLLLLSFFYPHFLSFEGAWVGGKSTLLVSCFCNWKLLEGLALRKTPVPVRSRCQVLLGGVSNWLGDHLEIFHSVRLRGVPFYYCMRVVVNLTMGTPPYAAAPICNALRLVRIGRMSASGFPSLVGSANEIPRRT